MKQNQTTKKRYDIREVMKTVRKKKEEPRDSFPFTPEETYPSPIPSPEEQQVVSEPSPEEQQVVSEPSPEEQQVVSETEEPPTPEETIPVVPEPSPEEQQVVSETEEPPTPEETTPVVPEPSPEEQQVVSETEEPPTPEETTPVVPEPSPEEPKTPEEQQVVSETEEPKTPEETTPVVPEEEQQVVSLEEGKGEPTTTPEEQPVDEVPVLLTEPEARHFAKSDRQQDLRKEKIEYEKGETPKGLYPSLNDKNFNDKISNKQEFFNTQYDATIYEIEKQADLLCHLPIEFHAHQTFVRNFLSSDTPYNSLLLYHGLGTGKTATAIGVAEEMRQYMRQTGVVKKIFIIASSNVRDNFYRELFNEDLIPENLAELQTKTLPFYMGEIIKEVHPTLDYAQITREELIGRVKLLIRHFYQFQGYRKMAIDIFHLVKYENNVLTERSKQSIRNRFNDTLLIVDEVHNIRANTENELEMKKIGELLTVAVAHSDNLRLLLMSATPVFNSYLEIIWLTNLLNLNDKRPKIKTSEVFYTSGDREGEYRDAQTLNGVTIEGGEALLKRKLTGYVSFVRGENPYSFPYRLYPDFFAPAKTYTIEFLSQKTPDQNLPLPTRQFNGQEIPAEKRLKYIRLYVNAVGEYQRKVYSGLLRPCLVENAQGCQKGAIADVLADLVSQPKKTGMEKQNLLKLQPIIQSLNIVYPNEKNPISDSGFNSVMLEERQQFRYSPGAERIFSPGEIGKYSCKMAAVLDAVMNSTGIVLVYSQFLKSGILSLALVLEEAGITRLGGPPLLKDTPSVSRLDALTMKPDPSTQSQAKYILVSGSKTYSPDNLTAIKEAVKLENKDGQFVKVILISGAGSEGIDFKFIRQVHILEPWYNMNKMEQIVGRAVRHKSHCALPFQQRNVEIYYHTVGLADGEEALDAFIYRYYAETKAIQIGKINRLMKETSVDVLLNIGQMNMTVEKLRTLSANQSIELQIPSGTKEKKYFPIGDKPHTETCDYMDCRYTNRSTPSGYALDRQTYGETFIKRSNSVLVPKVKALFREALFYTKKDLLSRINRGGKTYPLEEIYSALSYLTSGSNEILLDKDGRVGRLVIQGATYLFQPIETAGQNQLSLMENAIPAEYRKSSVLVEFPGSSRVIPDKQQVVLSGRNYAEEFRRLKETRGQGSVWFTELFKKQKGGKSGGEFCAYDFLMAHQEGGVQGGQQVLSRVLIRHYVEALTYSEKVDCMQQVVFLGDDVEDEEAREMQAYFRANSLIASASESSSVFCLYHLEEKQPMFWVYHGGEWVLEDDTTQRSAYYEKYARQKQEVFLRVAAVFGYMDWNAKKDRNELKTKKKGGGDKYNKGNFCVNQNKSSDLNKLLLLEFPEMAVLRGIEQVSIYSGCIVTEVLLRMRNEEDGGKTFFFSPEEYYLGLVVGIV